MPAKSLIVPVAVVLGLALAASGVPAADSFKVGYVEIEKITDKALFVRELVGDIERRMRAKRGEVEAGRDEYAALRDDLERKRSVLTENELETLLKKSRRLQNDIEEKEYELNKLLRQAEKEQMEPALDYILAAIEAIGKQEGYDLILRAEVVVHGSARADISDKVVERLNREFKEGKREMMQLVSRASSGGKAATAKVGERRPTAATGDDDGPAADPEPER